MRPTAIHFLRFDKFARMAASYIFDSSDFGNSFTGIWPEAILRFCLVAESKQL